jgi:hypothetical protein
MKQEPPPQFIPQNKHISDLKLLETVMSSKRHDSNRYTYIFTGIKLYTVHSNLIKFAAVQFHM